MQFAPGACRAVIVLTGLTVFFEAGCTQRNADVSPPPPEVVVGVPTQRSITIYHEYTGNTQASEMIEI
jgi:hypothetical protein